MDPLTASVNTIFADTFDEVEVVGELFGVKYIFAKVGTDSEYKATVMTTTCSTWDTAEARRARMFGNANFRTMLATWFSLHVMHEDNPLAWVPIASKVVHLAVIPF